MPHDKWYVHAGERRMMRPAGSDAPAALHVQNFPDETAAKYSQPSFLRGKVGSTERAL
jgi:hypothetical protein